MTQEEKAKAYDKALKLAREKRDIALRNGADITVKFLEEIFPELRESEDERIIEGFKNLLKRIKDSGGLTLNMVPVERCEAWLEKQKENPKNADSIPADCVSSAKCEDRSPKHSDSDGIDIRDTPAYWRGWDDAMKQKESKPPVDIGPCDASWDAYYQRGLNKGYELGLEAGRKEQKPYEPHNWPADKDNLTQEQKPELVQQPPITYTYNSNASRDERLKAALLALLNSDLLKIKEGGYFTKQDLIEWVERIPTDKTAWSEEDADILNCCISSIEEAKENRYAYKETDGDTSYDREIDWLKSLRPSWKPSEEQMDALKDAVRLFKETHFEKFHYKIESLYEQLKQL